MQAIIKPGHFDKTLRIPASKSHTIRRLILAALGEGVSAIDYPLDSLDARSCLSVCHALGAEIEERRADYPGCPNPADGDGKKLVGWTVRGLGFGTETGGGMKGSGTRPLDVGNSGTTLFLVLAAAALGDVPVSFTGDEQIARRSAGPLLDALSGLGIAVESVRGCVPITVRGPWKGGRVSIACPTSQYLSALLLAAPLAPAGTVTEIDVPLLNEKPYIEMTLSYLQAQGIPFQAAKDFSRFSIPGGACYRHMNGPVPGDFSSAAFPGGIAAITGGPVTLLGLDREDTQGDKAFFDMLGKMGCAVEWSRQVPDTRPEAAAGQAAEWALRVSRTGPLRSGEFDLNATPDLLPMMAVTAAYAEGDTALVNVAHARIKETDRIAVMAEELGRLGVRTTERPDGMIIHGNGAKGLTGGRVDGRGDHRIVMALAAGALGAAGPVEIAAAESAAVTYPGFLEMLGAELRE
ncbi:3-phosphoshikimate 1-carboxyvinyltransferase [Treponema primitia]|uniref:3-phosphoshikimate 1-carboxyvinyltransferase n=1 Tax=Treponema primitia TaxID=88058 RepID=UPI0002555196|nr:3-phosphoshikimate 1-carboxyvinyltransferase [Treponema primitia]